MTRRTTVITPTTQTDALYELPSQPFARQIVSACLYAFTQAVVADFQPELKITDVEGNVLFTATAFTNSAFNQQTSTIIWTSNANDIASNVVLGNALAFSPGGVYYPGIIGDATSIPASNLFTVTLYGSLPADTIPNLVLVTEDEDEDFMP